MFRWQWHGRQAFTEVQNDFRFTRRLRRVVYRLDDFCDAPDEAAARGTFSRMYPEAQSLGVYCVGRVKDEAPERMTQPELAL